MAENQEKQEPSENSQQDQQDTATHGENGIQQEKGKSSTPIDKLLSKIEKDIEEVKGNTKSESNIASLDRIEKAIERIPDILAATWSKLHLPPQESETKDATPATPELEVPTMIKTVSVRKRGGRVVTRHIKE